ncbi:unnamed protein product [Symbiodinium sp. CCMP2592]|nr:unnamed protein product [Symbiodinium sp. CCMP2592]
MSRAWSCLLHAWAFCWACIHSFFDAALVFIFALTTFRPNGHTCLMNLLVLGAHYGLADPQSCKQRIQRATLAASCLSGAIFLELRSSGDAWAPRTRGAAWLSLAAGVFCLQAFAPPRAEPRDSETLMGVVHRVWRRTHLQSSESRCGMPARAVKALFGVEHAATWTRRKAGDTDEQRGSSAGMPLRPQAQYQLEAESKQRAQRRDRIHQCKDRISVGCATWLWRWLWEAVPAAAQMAGRNDAALSKSRLHLQHGQHANHSICQQVIHTQAAQRVRDLPSCSLAHGKQHVSSSFRVRPVRDAVFPDAPMSGKGKEDVLRDVSQHQKENLQPLRKGLPVRHPKGMPGHLFPGTSADSKIGLQGIPAPGINASATLGISTCETTSGTRPKTHQDAIHTRSGKSSGHQREPLLAINDNNNLPSSELAGKQERQICFVQKPDGGWRCAHPFSEIAVRRIQGQAPGEVFVDPEFRSWPQEEVAAFMRICEHADVQHAQVMQMLRKRSWDLQARANCCHIGRAELKARQHTMNG